MGVEDIDRQCPLSAEVKHMHWLITYKSPADSIRQTVTQSEARQTQGGQTERQIGDGTDDRQSVESSIGRHVSISRAKF